MCGIIGVLRLKDKLDSKDRDIFTQLLHTGIVRGYHGTGVMAMQENGAGKAVKASGPPFQLCQTKKFQNFWDSITKDSPRALIGHNRLATTGNKTDDHAHPFIYKHIALVHNGTLDAGLTLPGYSKFAVDSEALCNSIADLGIDETMKRTSGAWAIVYIDGKEKTLNILRNGMRPLAMCYDSLASRIILASERDHLAWISKRNHITGTGVTIEDVPINTLLTFDLDEHVYKPRERAIEGKAYTTVVPIDVSVSCSGGTRWNPETNRYEPVNKPDQTGALVTNETYKRQMAALLQDPSLHDDCVTEFLASLGATVSQKAVLEASAQIAGIKNPPPADIREKQFAKNPRLREIYPNGKNYDQQDTLTILDKINGQELEIKYTAGEKLQVMVNDHVTEDESAERFVLVGTTDEIQNARVHFRVDGGNRLNELFEAAVVEVTLCRFMIPKVSDDLSGDGEIIIWAKDPKIISDDTSIITLH